jgi:hypothetical protein
MFFTSFFIRSCILQSGWQKQELIAIADSSDPLHPSSKSTLLTKISEFRYSVSTHLLHIGPFGNSQFRGVSPPARGGDVEQPTALAAPRWSADIHPHHHTPPDLQERARRRIWFVVRSLCRSPRPEQRMIQGGAHWDLLQPQRLDA